MNQVSNTEASCQLVPYELTHQGTELGTGWFAPEPIQDVEFEDGLAYIQEHPYDDFMHNYLLGIAGKFGPNLTRQLIERGKEESPHLLALMYEVCMLNERLRTLLREFDGTDIKVLAGCTPLIYVNWSLKKDLDQNEYWLRLFSENILRHKEPIPWAKLHQPIPFDREALKAWQNRIIPLPRLWREWNREASQKDKDAAPGLSPAETAHRALERLETTNVKMGTEERNEASLCQHALQITWQVNVHTSIGRNRWQLIGLQTSYGRGLTPPQARASCLMELVERISSFASFDSDVALRYRQRHSLIRGPYEELARQSYEVLDPNDMLLEAPYENQPLYWIAGERVDRQGIHPVLVPAQFIFLFCNLDEVSLTSGQPSTGLASGNTMEEAKLHGLLEIIERDAEKVMPYSRNRCFVLESHFPPIKEILGDCGKRGLQVQFLDITSEFGIPCYKAFIQGPAGEILKGCAAHPDGKRAAVAALTELPFHPSWFHPLPIAGDVKVLEDGDLPNYSSGDATHDLNTLERLLVANGYYPIYVNLTRKDLNIPVVKTLVPGLEMFAEFDRFSSLNLRQFGHYLEIDD